jgi:hypothetical protein
MHVHIVPPGQNTVLLDDDELGGGGGGELLEGGGLDGGGLDEGGGLDGGGLDELHDLLLLDELLLRLLELKHGNRSIGNASKLKLVGIDTARVWHSYFRFLPRP